ncbi:hypothetical protein pb186bvf_012368 [Paramecium bursaria]
MGDILDNLLQLHKTSSSVVNLFYLSQEYQEIDRRLSSFSLYITFNKQF